MLVIFLFTSPVYTCVFCIAFWRYLRWLNNIILSKCNQENPCVNRMWQLCFMLYHSPWALLSIIWNYISVFYLYCKEEMVYGFGGAEPLIFHWKYLKITRSCLRGLESLLNLCKGFRFKMTYCIHINSRL